jgi:sulfur relay (sulfurtransferase) DsrF/TusC family protein
MVKKILFLVYKPPFKSENSKLSLTHSLASFTAVIFTDEEIEPAVAFFGDGVLNCIKNQKSDEIYGINSIEYHLKNMLLSDMKILVCKEDMEKYGIKEERLADAKEMEAETAIQVVPFQDILKEMEASDHLMVF